MEIFYIIGTEEHIGKRFYLFYINKEPFVIDVTEDYLFAVKAKHTPNISLNYMLKNHRRGLVEVEDLTQDVVAAIMAATSLYAENCGNIQQVV